MRDIEKNNFNVNKRVITKRLARRNVKKIDGGYKKPDVIKNKVTEPSLKNKY